MFSKYQSLRPAKVDYLPSLPTHWNVEKGKWLFKKENRPVRQNDEVVTCFRDGQVTLRSNRRTEGFTNALQEHGYQGIKAGDLVIHAMDSFAGAIGVSDSDGKSSPVYSACTPLSVKQTNPYFYAYFMRDLALSGYLVSLAKGIRERSTDFRFKDFGELLLPVPPFEEQSLIASFLDKKLTQIDGAIQVKERQIERLKERKQILIQQAVTRGLDPHAPMRDSGIEWIGEIPAHWDIKKIRYLGTTQNGISAGAEFFGHGYPFVSYGDVYNNEQLPESVSGLANASASDRYQYSLECGDVLFTRTSETIEEIGFASTCFKGIANSTFAGFLIRFRPKTNALFEGFSKYYFNAPMLRDYFVKEMSIVTRASLSQQLLKNMPVLLPSVAEQKEIYAFLECESARFSNSINIQIQQIKNLKEYKSTLINSAVTGKIKVPGVVEPAEIQEREFA